MARRSAPISPVSFPVITTPASLHPAGALSEAFLVGRAGAAAGDVAVYSAAAAPDAGALGEARALCH